MPITKSYLTPKTASPLLLYSLILFFVGFADGMISYLTPIHLENSLGNPFFMGLIYAASSLVALIFDSLAAKYLQNKPFYYYLLLGLFFAILFPLVYLFLPPTIFFLLCAMAIWGIYYELLAFSNFHFIPSYLAIPQHARGWGILSSFKAAAYMLAPLLASSLLALSFKLPLYTTVIFTALAYGLYIIFKSVFPLNQPPPNHHPPRKSLMSELKIWRVLATKLWPLWLFIFALFLVDAAYWSVGAVLAEELRKINPLGNLMLTLYMLPSLFVGLIADKAARPFGKKRIAFLSGVSSGLILIIVGFTLNVPLILSLVLLASICGCLAVPEIMATFEDYLSRLHEFDNDLVSLERTAENLAYILGPILAGLIASLVGFHKAFSVIGIILTLVSVLAIIVVPRKIHMPQQQLEEISS